MEGLTASVIFVVGVVGIFSGIIMASRQNASANRLAEANGIARRVRAGLQAHGYARLVRTGGLFDQARCSTDPAVLELAAGLHTIGNNPCAIDLDAYEDAAVLAHERIVPDYSPETRQAYRRVLVWQRGTTTPPDIVPLMVVVSFGDVLGRRFVRHSMALYNPATNFAGVDL
jgi:hypothetical protein